MVRDRTYNTTGSSSTCSHISIVLACASDLSEYLEIIMDQEFDTIIEDGSLEEV